MMRAACWSSFAVYDLRGYHEISVLYILSKTVNNLG